MKAWAILIVALCVAACGQSTVGAAPDTKPSGSLAAAPEATVGHTGNGPFGLDLSAGPSELPIDKEASSADKGLYILKSVPSPSSSFSTYAVVAFDGLGICEIRAVSPDFQGDDLGAQVRAAADQLAETLDSKYGKSDHTDQCGSTCEPQFWSMAMGDGDRVYGYDWAPKPIDAITPRSVSLYVGANNLTPYMRLDYSFKNKTECDAALHKSAAANL